MSFGRIVSIVLLSIAVWGGVKLYGWLSNWPAPRPIVLSTSPPGIAEVVFEAKNGDITRLYILAKYKQYHNWSDEYVNFLTSSLDSTKLFVCVEGFFPSGPATTPCVNGERGGGAVIIEVFANYGRNTVSFLKKNSILPAATPRDFKVINGLMSLGFAKDYKGRTAGRRFYKQATDGKVVASWINNYYFVPVNETEWPEYYMWCARINDDLTPARNRWCQAYSQISPYVYVRYGFAGENFSKWKEFDHLVKQIVQLAPEVGDSNTFPK